MDVTTLIAEERAKLEHLADGVGYGIEPGIIETVAVLRLLGFRTRQSCEGHLDRGRPTPWVDMEVPRPHFLKRAYAEFDRATGQLGAISETRAEVQAQRIHSSSGQAELEGRLEELLERFYHGRTTPTDERLGLVPFMGLGFTLGVPTLLDTERNTTLRDAPSALVSSRQEMTDFSSFLRIELAQTLEAPTHAEPAPHESAVLAVAKAPILGDIYDLAGQAAPSGPGAVDHEI